MPRKPSRTDLPPHLYESGGYYSWRDPNTGKTYGLGRDRAAAIDQAKRANAFVARQAPALPERIETPSHALVDFLPIYREALADRELAPRTRYGRARHVEAIERALGDLLIGARQEDAAEVTRRCAEWLRAYENAGKRRMAKALRSTLVDLFAEMAAAGWLAVNPAKVIALKRITVRRARLTLDDFWRIYEAAPSVAPWLPRALELAVVSLQRREDVAGMRFRDIGDGRLRVEQRKTGARIRVPLTLRLQAVGWSLEEIVGRCRDAVLSQRLVHHTRHQGGTKPGAAVHPQTITRAFAEARAIAGVKTEPRRTPPTYHELRSLGARLYVQQGFDPQALLGHKDAATTAVYKDARGAEWIDVAA